MLDFLDFENYKYIDLGGGVCNMDCDYCNAPFKNKDNLEEFYELDISSLIELKKNLKKEDKIIISGGEPTLAPKKRLFQLLNILKQSEIPKENILFFTNLTAPLLLYSEIANYSILAISYHPKNHSTDFHKKLDNIIKLKIDYFLFLIKDFHNLNKRYFNKNYNYIEYSLHPKEYTNYGFKKEYFIYKERKTNESKN